jgi:xanthine dehydrogenase accessory factor
MRTDLLARAESLRQARTPYVLATVVRAERPTSAKAGDGALILADGTLDGFVGGTCAESTVRLQGLRLLRTGTSTLLRITPEPEAGQPDPENPGQGPVRAERTARPSGDAEGLTVVNNPCLSGGSLEIFLEAMLPAPLIHVHGDAPVARSLVRIGAALGYDLVVADASTAIPPDTAAVVVASHGRGEEAALAAAIRADVPYIALVASRRRGEVVLTSVGAAPGRVHSPAGLDIGARSAAEVAVSILAEIIATRPAASLAHLPDAPAAPASTPGSEPESAARSPQPQPATAVDPVCGMTVTVGPDALTAEHAGQAHYFCGSGCRAAFVDDPHRYVAHG